MNATGIVRKVDELGRVVIPKEIRKRFKMRNGDDVEIFIHGRMVCIAKYEPEKVLTEKVGEIMADMINSFDPLNPRQVRALENLKELKELIIERES